MKTIPKQNLGYSPMFVKDLENEAEITALIQEVETALKPCPCCGKKHPRIRYSYVHEAKYPIKDASGDVVFQEYPHLLYAECPRPHQNPELVDKGCGIRTQDWHAADDEADFRKVLHLIADTWNKRENGF